jgi:hypothetical protein
MGAALSSIKGKTWAEMISQPLFLTTAAIIIASAALIFLGALTKKRFKGSYSVVDKNMPRANNECTFVINSFDLESEIVSTCLNLNSSRIWLSLSLSAKMSIGFVF